MQRTCFAFLLCVSFSWLASVGNADEAAEFKAIFDGESLDGWDGDLKFWSVQDNAITAKSTDENPLKRNSFLIYRGGDVADFDLRLKFRVEVGNAGIQYRSQEVEEWMVAGYQADIDADNRYTGILYDEDGRGILANRGERAVGSTGEEIRVTETFDVAESTLLPVKQGAWNDYRILAVGPRLLHYINGKLTAEFLDGDADHFDASGLLALQIHSGPPMKVQYKEIRIKTIDETNRPSETRLDGSDARSKTHRVVFLAGTKSHRYGAHEHNAGCLLLAKELGKSFSACGNGSASKRLASSARRI